MLTKQEKMSKVKSLGKAVESYSVIGLLNMHTLPGKQLHKIREKLNGIAVIRMSKKKLLIRTLESSGKKILVEKLGSSEIVPALILSNENPFMLFRILKENRIPAAAKAGATATKDVLIQKGSTPLPPGPAISTLQKVGLKTSVQGGKIAVLADKVVLKAGEKFSDDIVGVLSLLKIEPMEIGLDVVCAWDGGIIFGKEILNVDTEEYLSEMQRCIQNAVNLSVNAGYPTKLTIELMLQKAFNEAKGLCMEAKIIEKEFIGDLLAKAVSEADALGSLIKK